MSDRSEPRRALLSVADALDFAAEQLGKMAADQNLLLTIKGIVEKSKTDMLKDMPVELREAMIEPERQERALKEATRIIRTLATEHRVLDMRELDQLRAKQKERAPK